MIGQGGVGGFSMAGQAENAGHAVDADGTGAGDFRQAALGLPAHQLHLEQAVAGVQVA